MNLPFLTTKTAPHLVLGVKSNANQQEVITAFATRSRKVKSGQANAFSIEDLTSALSEIESSSRDNSPSLRYSVPANSAVVKTEISFCHNDVTYDHKSDFQQLQVSEITPDLNETAADVFLAASLYQILDWNWETASNYARECFRLSRREDVRDESLNILAACFAMQGDLERSLFALKKAVEGQWNLQLQINLAIIATEQDPSLAVSHMSYIVNGAKLMSERLLATRLAIQLWNKTQSDETGSDDEDDFAPLPKILLSSFYALTEDQQISEEDFFEIGLFLARVDPKAFITSGALERSHHSQSLSAQAVQARTEGYIAYIEKLGSLASLDSQRKKAWLHETLDSIISTINAVLIDDDADKTLMSSIAFGMIDNGLDCSNFARISLRALLINQLPELLEANSLPADNFINWHNQASAAIGSRKTEFQPGQLEVLQGIHEHAGNVLALMNHRALLEMGAGLERTTLAIKQRMTGLLNRWSADVTSIKETANSIFDGYVLAIQRYHRVIPLVTIPEMLDEMNNTVRTLENLRNTIARYR